MNPKTRWVVYIASILVVTLIMVLLTYRQSINFDLFAISVIYLQSGVPILPVVIYIVFIAVSVVYGIFWFFFFFTFGIIFLASFGKAIQISVDEKDLPNVSILIAALNEEQVIERTLSNLVKVKYPKEKLEILIVASGSTDRTEEICRKFKEITVLNDPVQKPGKPAALNYGVKNVKNDIIVMYDADCIVQPDSLIPLAATLTDSQYEGAVGPVQIHNRVNSLTKGISLEYCFFTGRGLMFHIKQRLGRHPEFMGSNCAIRKSALEKLGGFNEEELTEDLRIGFELRTQNKKVGFAPEARVEEMAPTTWDAFYKQRLRWYLGYFRIIDSYKSQLGPVTGLSMMTHVQYPLLFLGVPIFALLISLISMGIGIPLNAFLISSGFPVSIPPCPIEQAFLSSSTILFFSLDWMVIGFSIIALIFNFGLLFNSVRKYGNRDYSLLKYLLSYMRVQWLGFKHNFKDPHKVQLAWEKTEKSVA